MTQFPFLSQLVQFLTIKLFKQWCYFQKQLFVNLNGAANLIYIELPSLNHRSAEFFFMLPHRSLSPVSFIHYQLIWQHLSEKWHASNQTSFPMTSPSHLESFMDADCVGAQVVRDLGLTARRFTLGVMDRAISVSDLDWSLLSFGGKRQCLQCSPAPAWVISLCLGIPFTSEHPYKISVHSIFQIKFFLNNFFPLICVSAKLIIANNLGFSFALSN